MGQHFRRELFIKGKKAYTKITTTTVHQLISLCRSKAICELNLGNTFSLCQKKLM